MRRSFLWVTILLFLVGGPADHLQAAPKPVVVAPPFTAGGLQFAIPPKWISEPVESSARVGQWFVPPLHVGDEGGEVVVFYFGLGVGGSAQQNIEAWIGTMVDAAGHPAAAEKKQRTTAGFPISQVAIFGTYNQTVPVPGVPPQPRMNYGLLGAVIEGKQGNLYWRFTGPETLITANLPVFTKVIDSLKPADK